MKTTSFISDFIARWKSKTPYFSKVAAYILFIVAFADAGVLYLLGAYPDIFTNLFSPQDLATIKMILIAIGAVTTKQAIAAKLKVENEPAFEALQALQAKAKAQQAIATANVTIVQAQAKAIEQAQATVAVLTPVVEMSEPLASLAPPVEPKPINPAL